MVYADLEIIAVQNVHDICWLLIYMCIVVPGM